MSTGLSNFDVPNITLAVGDTIHYYDPIMVAGSPGSSQVSKIVKIHPGNGVFLENQIFLDQLTQLRKEGYTMYLYFHEYIISSASTETITIGPSPLSQVIGDILSKKLNNSNNKCLSLVYHLLLYTPTLPSKIILIYI